MNLFSKFSIATKIIFVLTVLAAIFFGTSFAYIVINVRNELSDSTIRILETEVANEVDKIETVTVEVRNTVVSLNGTPPIQGIIRARDNDGFDELENLTFEQWQNRLASIFIAEMNSTGFYDQLRYLDEDGQEIVRVNYVNGIAKKVPNGLLQNKKNRDYFKEASSLGPDQVHVSHVELNKEGNPPTISEPYKPVIRYAVSLFDEVSGDKKGILIANVLAEKIIAENYLAMSASADVYITDSEGYYLVHPEESKKWGDDHDLNTGANFYKEFLDITKLDFEGNQGSLVKNSDIFVYAKVLPDSSDVSREWLVLERTPTAVVFNSINTIVRNAFLVGLGTFVVLFFALLFIIKRLLNPLAKLSEAVTSVGKGNFDQKVEVGSDDEIGKLAQSFNLMADKLKESYATLDKKVQMRTQELERLTNYLANKRQASKKITEGKRQTDNKKYYESDI